ncbi:MAG: hypothetical protein L3J19_00975 [Sulfurimonas sp.]|nr:hypothetical protein [Sulfurimonas sp.]
MNIMEIGFNALQSIGTSYSIKLNEKEAIVFEEDSSYKVEKSDSEKLQDNIDKEESKKTEKSKSTDELSQEEKQLVQDLQSRDTEVRGHEAAHQGAGGGMTGGASFTYQQGPDRRMYAIGGEVSISIPTGSTPQESIRNARQAIAAAMAPSDPSGQDFSVASSAMVMMMKAEQQKAKELQEEILGKETYKNEAQISTNDKESNGIDIPT